MFEFDTTSNGYPRISCSKCGGAVPRQPFMSDHRWLKEVEKFKNSHKCENKDAEEV